MKTRAAILKHSPCAAPYAVSRPLVIEELELDPPSSDEVLIRMAAVGLCHSDHSVINGARLRQTPMVLGHEAAGAVAQVGSANQDLQAGDRVVMTFQPVCGHCLPCAEGPSALCIPGNATNGKGFMLAGGVRLHDMVGQHGTYHHCGVSGFAEYAVISRRRGKAENRRTLPVCRSDADLGPM